MEIKFDKFNEWTNYEDLLTGLSPVEVIGESTLNSYLAGTVPELNTSEIMIIEKMQERVEQIMDLSQKVEKEIDINIIGLIGSPNLNSYLKFIKDTHLNSFQNIKHMLRYSLIRLTKIDFDDYEELSVSDITAFAVSPEVFEKLPPRDKLDALNNGYGIGFNDDGSINGFTRNIHSDPISRYLSALTGLLKIYEQTQEFIELKISPAKEDLPVIKSEDSRHVISDPTRRVFHDKWSAVFKDVRDAVDKNLNAIREINEQSYHVGGGNESFDNFIDWGSNLTNATVPDGVFSYEIMNEIDVNLLEIKTVREKDRYLAGISEEMNHWATAFKSYLRTHPDYRKRVIDFTVSENDEIVEIETQALIEVDNWRALSRDRRKYSLNLFYAQLLVLSEVLKGISTYVEGFLSSEKIKITPDEINDEPTLQADRHRLLLLNETGAFEFLVSKYPINPSFRLEDFAKLIATIVGAKSKEFRSEVGKLKAENADPKKNKSVQSKAAMKKVATYITSLGLLQGEDT